MSEGDRIVLQTFVVIFILACLGVMAAVFVSTGRQK